MAPPRRAGRGGIDVSAAGSRTVLALALQCLALVTLTLALVGVSWLDDRSKPRVLVLVDRSDSVPRAGSDNAVATVVRAARQDGAGEVQRLEFAGRPAPPSAPGTDAVAALEPSTTDIEAALEAALAAHAQAAYDSLVVVSDGLENVGDAARALRAARDARLPVHWMAVGRPPPALRVAEVLAPDRAVLGQRIQITVQLAGQVDQPVRVKATARAADGQTQAASSEVAGAGRVRLELDAGTLGAVRIDVALEEPASGRAFDAMADAAVVDVVPRAAILYAQGSTGALARSLLGGGWRLNVVPAARLDAHADGLDGYRAVVLEDIAIADAGARFWTALVTAVKERGLGLIVLGGERSFARGGYRGSALESVLPLLSEPAALDLPAAIVFAVDKSGSMGQGSGGVDRFSLARRAVLETARGLGERDALGLVVFDAAPRVLIPLGPAPAGTAALARDWQASPNGGTRLAPALDAAIGELERSVAARRMLVIVTDGFVDEVPLAALRARLERARIETIALAVGPDADVGALERLIGSDAGQVLRVDQAAELPLVMRAGLERRRARIERGDIAVAQPQALPFADGQFKGWPAIAAHAVTRLQPQAVVAVQSQRGEPLIAFQRAGLGRVVAVASGVGPWTPQWLQWPEWPRLAGGLADWVSGRPRGGAAALTVSDQPAAMRIDAETADRAAGTDALSIVVQAPTTPGRLLATQTVAPGRLQATLADPGPGLYTFLVSGPHGTQRQLHLRRHRAEHEAWGTSPALDSWRSAGLIVDWRPEFLAPRRDVSRAPRPLDRSLLGLALALFLGAVLVDRTRLEWARVSQGLRRLRRRD
jgi:uncharacterized membrane protein